MSSTSPCAQQLRLDGKPSPRTCQRCGLGPCNALALPASAHGAKPEGWQYLTDEDRARAFNSMPDMLEGFMKTWGWLHFAKAIEAECQAKNSNHQPPKD